MLGGEGHLKVSVTGVNDAPVLNAESVRVEENGGAALTTTVFDIKLSDDDPASDVTITASALHGTLSPVDVGDFRKSMSSLPTVSFTRQRNTMAIPTSSR